MIGFIVAVLVTFMLLVFTYACGKGLASLETCVEVSVSAWVCVADDSCLDTLPSRWITIPIPDHEYIIDGYLKVKTTTEFAK